MLGVVLLGFSLCQKKDSPDKGLNSEVNPPLHPSIKTAIPQLTINLPLFVAIAKLACICAKSLVLRIFFFSISIPRRFLTLLGRKVKLKGWEGYRGGLDVKQDQVKLCKNHQKHVILSQFY